MPGRSRNVTVPTGGSVSATLTVNAGCGTAPGSYAVRVNATSTNPSIPAHWVILPVAVTASACGGRVAEGPLVTVADRAHTPVQDPWVRLQLPPYDMYRNEYAVTTITSFDMDVTYNQIVIKT